MKKKAVIVIVVILIILGTAIYYLDGAMPIGSGYSSKYLCSQVFLSGRDPNYVFEHEVKPTNPLFRLFDYQVDYKAKTVSAAGFGFWHPVTAVYRQGFGCTLAIDVSYGQLQKQAEGALPQSAPDREKAWPEGELADPVDLMPEVDTARLNQVVADAFVEPTAEKLRNTQAVVIVYKNRLIAEKYHPQFGPATPILGWSMSKSVTSALVGILVKEGKLRIADPAPVAAWQIPGDPKSKITLDQLLRMSSGLEFDERYEPYSDAVNMLFDSNSMARFAAAKPLKSEPDGVWSYSSGTTNIIAGIVKNQVGGTLVAFNNYARKNLFDRLAMHSAVIEPDASGSFVGSSYMFATARDWARIGLLYLNDGEWGDDRIFPEGWVTYSTTPTPKAPRGEYGAQIWLNAGEKGNESNRLYPSLPTDLYYFGGFNGQTVAVVPSRKVVVVRLGVTHDDAAWNVERFIAAVLDCIESK